MTNSSRIVLPNRFKDPYDFEYVIELQDTLLGEAKELDFSRISFIEPY